MGLKHKVKCVVQGCAAPFSARGLCKNHYAERCRSGDITQYASTATPKGASRAFLEANVAFASDECLVWPHATVGSGYGIIRVQNGERRRSLLAHRIMCELAHGRPPNKRAQAAHSCNNRLCVNPRHLRWATPRENIMDKIEHGTMPRGEKVHSNRLTEAEVLAIYKDGRCEREIAKAYQVAKGTVNHIRSGRSWSWLTGHSQTRRIGGKWESSAPHRQTIQMGVA